MVLQLGCTIPDLIAAFHGTADPNVPFEGGPTFTGPEHTPTGARVNGVRAALKAWAQSSGGSGNAVSEGVASDVILEKYSNDVFLYVVEGGGHTRPVAAQENPAFGKTAQSISATDFLWEFFRVHPRK